MYLYRWFVRRVQNTYTIRAYKNIGIFFFMTLVVTILAAGEGKRMRSDIPKVLHSVSGKPMLVRVVEAVREIEKEMSLRMVVVTGRHHRAIVETLSKWIDIFGIVFIEQPVPIGTGHAVRCCMEQYAKGDKVLVLNGDMPLLTGGLLSRFVKDTRAVAAVISAKIENPTGYGRILYGTRTFTGIVEEKDATPEQREIREINAGVYLFDATFLHEYLPKIKNENQQREYYLTDIFILAEREAITTFLLDKSENVQIRGVNTPEELAELEAAL